MRRFVIAAVAILALAAPATASAKTATHAFTLGAGPRHSFKLTLAHPGRIQIVLRYSRIRNPKADVVINFRQANDPDGNLILDTGGAGAGCQKGGDNYVCSLYLSGLSAGTYFVTVGKETRADVPVHLRLSWPAS